MTITELCIRAFDNSKAKGFHEHADVPERFDQRLMLIVSELAEAMEERRAGRAPDELYFVGEKPEGVPAEIADAFIRLGDFCAEYRINIERAIEAKMAYNETRPHKHGGKKY